MATVFKTFLNDDMASTRTLLHEAIPVSGGILFGTYPEPGDDLSNIKTYTHGMFQSVYDYSYTKSSANHIFDITVGYSSATSLTVTADTHKTSKEMIYNEFAKILMGHDDSGNINRLDFDGDLLTTLTDKIDECYVISVARLLNKDEIKKGSFYMDLDVSERLPVANICAGDGATTADGTVTIANTSVVANDTVVFKTLDGTTITATAGTATTGTDIDNPTFDVTTSAAVNNVATALAACLNANSKLTASAGGAGNAVVTITQVAGYTINAITVTNNTSGAMTKTDFTGGTNGNRRELKLSDAGAENDYRVNSPVGDYGILKCVSWANYPLDADATCTDGAAVDSYIYATNTATGFTAPAAAPNSASGSAAGLIFYQAGVVILSPLVFVSYGAAGSAGYDMDTSGSTSGLIPHVDAGLNGKVPMVHGTSKVDAVLAAESIDAAATGLRKRINKIAFNNTTELNSTIYFCRANHNDFNYSSNPTYLKDSQIRVKENQSDAPVAYITSIGLYSSDNELLATAKLSEPLRKDPTTEMVLRVRLDY